MRPHITVVIPARMASSRYPGKPLALIAGLPMIEHVRRRAMLAKSVDEVVVATCDREIMAEVEKHGGRAIMTSDKHERSSERVAEAMRSLPGNIVINAQGDEPLLIPEALEQVVAPFLNRVGVESVSLLSPLESDADYTNPSIVKAACDLFGNILYYTRAHIPYFMKPGQVPIYRETGIRAFSADFLQKYVRLAETPLERVESVDMLRIIEHGRKIVGVVTDYTTMGVDHPEDVSKAEEILCKDKLQKTLHLRIV